jgi:hypothetical protein
MEKGNPSSGFQDADHHLDPERDIMRHLLGWVFAAGLLIAPTSRAHAQFTVSFGYPAYGAGYSGFGYGYPAYGYPGTFGGYAANGFLPGASYYSSGYSSYYAAPGTSSFVSGTFSPYPYPGVAPMGGYGVGYPGSYGSGYGYAPSFGGNSRWVSTGMFMGLPRPGGGLVRVPY